VPSCVACNRGKGDGGATNISDDEEYVRTIFCGIAGPDEHPVARRLMAGKIQRSLARITTAGRPAGLGPMLAGKLKTIQAELPNGLWIPDIEVIPVDRSRRDRVLRKITRGLFYHVKRHRMPPSCEIEILPLSGDEFRGLARKLNMAYSASDWIVMGEDEAFISKGMTWPSRQETSVWFSRFYRRLAFAASISPARISCFARSNSSASSSSVIPLSRNC
jgi:hypothetical protein